MSKREDTTNIYKGKAHKGEIQIIHEKPVYENRYGVLYDDEVLFPSGEKGNYIGSHEEQPFCLCVARRQVLFSLVYLILC